MVYRSNLFHIRQTNQPLVRKIPHLSKRKPHYSTSRGIKNLFQKLGTITGGAFKVIGGQFIQMEDELIVLHATHRMTVDNNSFEVDAVVIWRVVENHFAEARDIPAINTTRQLAEA